MTNTYELILESVVRKERDNFSLLHSTILSRGAAPITDRSAHSVPGLV
jgi:hypothetical protein